MSIMDTLLPASPPEPTGARVVRLLGPDPVSSPEELERYRRENERYRARKAASMRELYWRRRAAQ